MLKKVLHKIAGVYDAKYKQLLIIPIVILLLSIGILANHYIQTGDFVSKGVSLKGGTTISISVSNDVGELSKFLVQKFPESDISVRSLSKAGSQAGIIVEATDIDSLVLLDAIQEKIGSLQKDQYTVDTTGSSLGESFFKQALISVLIAFVLMAIVVYLYFRDPLPCFYAVFSVLANSITTLAIFNLLEMRLTTGGIAAFLMLIGYSIDTDILLTTRVLKRTEGTVSERMASALPTGMTMTFAALAAVVVAYFTTSSELLKQIMFILGCGLVSDVMYTWLFNAPILRLHVERKQKNGL